jgi:death-on-curing protein
VTEPIWLPIEVVIETNRKIVTETGEPFFLRDRALLESAMEKPKNHYYYASEDDILNLSTILMFGIARNHPFEQGNKRSGFLSAVFFLERNGYAFSFYDSGSVGKAITFVLEGRMTERKFIESIRPYVVPL